MGDLQTRAAGFRARQARLLEQRLYATLFEGAPAAGVVEALRGYQNEDGGFGHALGTGEAVRSFGLARAEDCQERWYARSAQEHGLTTASELAHISQAWLEWSRSPAAYAAFAWCRAVGRKPQ